MKKLILPALLFFTIVAFSQDSNVRFIEVSGTATRTVTADEYHFFVKVIPGEACQIPKKGRDWEKLMKQCKEENNHLVASRESVLNAIVESFGGKIMEESNHAKTSDYEMKNKRYFTCRSYNDYKSLVNKLDEMDGAFTSEILYAINNNASQIAEELSLEALKNAKEKAVNLAASIGERVGGAFQLFEGGLFNSASLQNFGKIMEMEAARQSGIPLASNSPITPDNNGLLHFANTMSARFFLIN